MNRFVLIAALLPGACGAADDRPRTLAYITDAILTPTCANAECHSAFVRQVGDQFDTVEAARLSIVGNGLVTVPDDVMNPSQSLLIRTLTVGVPSILDPEPGNLVRMPYDAPMPDADLELIRAWIAEGAEGAQCVANAAGQGCSSRIDAGVRTYEVVECTDGNVGAVVMDCPQGQFCTLFSGNGQCVGQ